MSEIERIINQKVRSGEEMIRLPMKAAGGTNSGYNWLIQVTDPNHDKNFKLIEDWPDNFNGSVVTRRIVQTIEIKKPATLPAGNWDLHVVRWPNLNGAASNFTPTTSRNNNSVTTSALPVPVSAPVGGVQAYAVPAGTDIQVMLTGGTVQAGRLDIDPVLSAGASRVVADSFEVHNTTAVLQKQGSVITWRANAYSIEKTTVTHSFPEGLATRDTTYSAQPVRYPPSNAKEAMYLAGSRQWEAARGCYCVGVFQSDQNPMLATTNETMVILANDRDGTEGLESAALNVPVPYQPAPVGTITPHAAVPTVRVHPLHAYGSMFLGLSDQTSLTLTTTSHVTVAPAQGDVAIIQLTRPSSDYDSVALEVYSRYVQNALSGCPADENGFADFFYDAAKKISSFLGPVLSAIPHPIAQGAGAAMNYFGKSADAFQKPKQLKKAPTAAQAREMTMIKDAVQLQQATKKKKKAKKKLVAAERNVLAPRGGGRPITAAEAINIMTRGQ